LSRLPRGIRLASLFAIASLLHTAAGQRPDDALVKWIAGGTDEKLKLTFESRERYERRGGQAFGANPDLFTGLVRNRLGLSYAPVKWLKFSGMLQDSRAPWYGPNAPTNMRDPVDLHEAYIQIGSGGKRGLGMNVGRMMLNYGEGRLIGTPQWGNVSRTYDQARVWYGAGWARFEVLMVSAVKARLDEFNRPVLGDRIWGTYNSFPNFYGKQTAEVYVLRHDQNRPGGFTGGSRTAGTDRLAVNTFGFRLTGPLGNGFAYSLESAWQTGEVGPATHRGAGWYSAVSRKMALGKRTLDLSAEYKYASGNSNPQDKTRDTTFDQLSPANHDKFGHQDLFGWRNIHNIRSVATLGITKRLSLSGMYNNSWLASRFDSLYNGSGKSIARSAAGNAGRHIGQEADIFGTWKFGHFQIGAGYGYLFTGGFLNKTTPGVSPSYFYVFHTYTL